MQQIRLTTALKAATIAGLLGGLAMGLFFMAFAEPVIDQALDIEKQFAAAEVEIVSRGLQKIGLLAGTVIFGAILGCLFAGPYTLFYNWLPGSDQKRKGIILAAIAYWSVVLFLFFKYPANPPGVGDPDTIDYRQAILLGFLALSVMGTGLAIAFYHIIKVSGKLYSLRVPIILGGYIIYALALFFIMPPSPDQIRIPLDLVWRFRWLSLAGNTLMWLVLGATFILFMRRFSRDKVASQKPVLQAR